MLQLYVNIKNRRNELQMTQSELAEKLGYADKSMIAKIEKGLVDIPQTKILAFADALQVSASDLMGWEDDELLQKQKNSRKAYAEKWNLQFFEKKMLQSFTPLNDDNKKKSIAYTENLLSNQKLDEELLINAAHERTDIEVTDEVRKNDDDIMDDENF